MRKLSLITVTIALLCTAAALHAQRVIRIVDGRPVVQENEQRPDKPPAASNVKEIEPTAEERDRIADLLTQLGAPRLVLRDRAMSELAQYEARALGQIRAAKGHDDDEVAMRSHLLEQVILSGQGELFLAARTLGLSISELNAHLENPDITPLLTLLKARAQPGQISLWTNVMGRVAGTTRLYPAAELAREVEGSVGYGQALSRCVQTFGSDDNARNFLFAAVLLPPGEPEDAIEALARVNLSTQDDSRMLEQVLSAAEDFRGLYPAPDIFAARVGRPQPDAEDPPGAADLRLTLALLMVEQCDEATLLAAGLPSPETMSPLVLDCWLRLLARSGLAGRLEAAVGSLPAERAAQAAGVWAGVAPVHDVISRFAQLSPAAQLAVLDTLWVNPRDAAQLQPWLLQLASGDSPALRMMAVRQLAQYRAPSTAAALEAAVAHAELALPALESLAPMGDLLQRDALDRLLDAFANAGPELRPALARVLVNSGDVAAADALLVHWRKALPDAEFNSAATVCARDATTPQGAWCKVRAILQQPLEQYARGNVFGRELMLSTTAHTSMLRALLARDTAQGFALLHAIAADVDDPLRLFCMMALAVAGRDQDRIEEWIKRAAGDLPDPTGEQIAWAVAFSSQPQATEFRRNVISQGAGSAHLPKVLQAWAAGCAPQLTPQDVFGELLQSVEHARRFATAWRWVPGELPDAAAQNLVSAVLLGDGSVPQPALALWVRQSGVDVLKILYGSSDSPAPRDASQALATALLGEPERARPILDAMRQRDDGSLWFAGLAARAWLGMLEGGESARVARALSADAGEVLGALRAASLADQGDAVALRRLLDRLGPQPMRFQRGMTAGVLVHDQQRGRTAIHPQGLGEAMLQSVTLEPQLTAGVIRHWLPDVPQDWAEWWSSRRALLHSGEQGLTMIELP